MSSVSSNNQSAEFIKQQKPLILASGSTIRQKLLHSLGLDFLVIPSDCDEDIIKKNHQSESIIDLGLTLAMAKALAVSKNHPKHYIIGADQLCVINDTVLDKPLNHPTAIKHLRMLSGKQHQQIACLCIAHNHQILWQHHEIASLTVRPLSDATIEAYLQLEQPYQSCGAYQFETQDKWLFEDVKGSEGTILGLPLTPLINALRQTGVVAL